VMAHHGQEVFLAGGFVRDTLSRQTPADIDLYAADQATLAELRRRLNAAFQVPTVETEFAVTYLIPDRPPIQVIRRWTFDHPQPLLEAFDFTIAQAVVWWEAGSRPGPAGHLSGSFFRDLAAKRLRYTSPAKPEAGASLLRAFKFAARGYRIDPESLADLVANVAVEAGFFVEGSQAAEALFHAIRAKLREIDPLTRRAVEAP
jgi:hypothetical protein